MGREDREKRVSAARRRAETHSSGYATTCLQLPEGVKFFEAKPGIYIFDIIPYIVKKGKDEPGGNPMADAGELYFERTYWRYSKIGPEEKKYIATHKTFRESDYVQEFRNAEAKKADVDQKFLKSLNPQERQLFLVYEPKFPEKGIQLLDMSHFVFGNLLDSRINNSSEEEGWDLFYFPDQDGMSLRVTIEEENKAGFKFNKVTAIDFIPRKTPLPSNIVNHKIDLDAMLIKTSYEDLKAAFLGTATGKKDEAKSESNGGADDDIPFDDKQEEPAKKEEPKKSQSITVEDYGLKAGDYVIYNGKRLKLAKVVADGTLVNLLDEEEADVIKDVDPAKLKKAPMGEAKEEPKAKETPKEEPKAKETKAKESEPASDTAAQTVPDDDDDEGWEDSFDD